MLRYDKLASTGHYVETPHSVLAGGVYADEPRWILDAVLLGL